MFLVKVEGSVNFVKIFLFAFEGSRQLLVWQLYPPIFGDLGHILFIFQLKSIHKEIERAAKKGQGISVSKKKQDFEDYKEEMRKEEKVIAENSEKCKELVERLSKADEQLKIYGVSSPPVDSLSKFQCILP